MTKINEIFEAWLVALNPDEEFKMLSTQRFEICTTCEFKKEVVKNKKWSFYCSQCSCPINKKIFSTKYNPCPKSKWESVDKNYSFLYKDKTDKSLF